MTEREKMINGKLYNPMDKEFISKTSTHSFRHGEVSGTFTNVFVTSLIRL